MDKLREIYEDWEYDRITALEAMNQIRKIYLLTDEELNLKGLTIEYCDYGIHKLRQNREYLMEGSETECLERASEIIFKK